MTTNLRTYLTNHAETLYSFINEEILQGIGQLNKNYFNQIIQNILKNTLDLEEYCQNTNLLPYFILTRLSKNGKIDYTSLRVDTLNFNHLDKEASVYYNYAQLSIQNNSLNIELKQTKIGGMPIDKDIVKFTKIIPIQENGFDKFIQRTI